MILDTANDTLDSRYLDNINVSMVLVVMYVEDIVIAVHNTGANDSEENCCAGVLGRHSRLDIEHQDVQQLSVKHPCFVDHRMVLILCIPIHKHLMLEWRICWSEQCAGNVLK